MATSEQLSLPRLILRVIFGRLDWLIIISSALLVAILWVLVLFTFPQDTPAAVLHYSVGTGIDIIGEGRQILVLPIIGTVLLIFNAALARYIIHISKQAHWALLGLTPLIQLILLTAYILLWRLN